MNKIIPLCPKCQKPLTHVDRGYVSVVHQGAHSEEMGAIAFACPSCRTLLGLIPDLESQIGEVESLVQGLPDRLDQ